MCVRPLEVGDLGRAAALHREVLDIEFLSRYGVAFLRTYYRAWLEAPEAIALAAVDEHGDLLGVLLGAIDPAVHVSGMMRGYGIRLGARIVSHALAHPSVARDLVATRGIRYARGVVRVIGARFVSSGPSPPEKAAGPLVAEITHLLVEPTRQGSGVGRALVQAAQEEALAGGRGEMILVTPPDLAARSFYERLGWRADGEVTSRSGEHFVRFRLALRPSPTAERDGTDPSSTEVVHGPLLLDRAAPVDGDVVDGDGTAQASPSDDPASPDEQRTQPDYHHPGANQPLHDR